MEIAARSVKGWAQGTTTPFAGREGRFKARRG
jgi:hypothetical protein